MDVPLFLSRAPLAQSINTNSRENNSLVTSLLNFGFAPTQCHADSAFNKVSESEIT